MVIRDDINLRDGPGVQYPVVQKMMMGDQLVVLGRMADNIWLYVKTTEGNKGWIKTVLVNTAGMNMNDHPIKTPSPSPNATVMVAGDRVYLRAGPGTFFSTIQKLIYGDSLMLLGKMDDNSWLYVKTTDGQEGWIKTRWVNLAGLNLDYNYVPIATSPPTETSTPVILPGIEGRWIDVDLSEQMLFAYEGTERVASFLVSTGTALYPTEQGEYRIYVKYLFTDMHGSDYFLPDVPFTMYYSGDFSIHGTYWHHNFGTPMSHGCINMDTSEAEWLYNWASVGTIVNIHR
ncbi:MAG TPA: L,D-transpeptidase family protein [Anaerolineaceae bacterium]|nr:L,D-transpeptidase family protein [Anaerolineaceae bacterium]